MVQKKFINVHAGGSLMKFKKIIMSEKSINFECLSSWQRKNITHVFPILILAVFCEKVIEDNLKSILFVWDT